MSWTAQGDFLNQLRTRVVAPLRPSGLVRSYIQRLNPGIVFHGEPYVLETQLLSVILLRELGPPLASVAERQYEIGLALDLLLTGI